MPRGVLLVGPPGTGKTLLARAVAGEAKVPFFSATGSEFIELFVGVGAARVRDLFENARKAAPAIVFIDEIDAVGRVRGAGLGGGHDEREQTLNQLLAAMDGFERNDRVIVLAATNRPDVLDPALLRPGRFDRRVMVERPERAARRAILDVHTRKKPLGDDVSLDSVATETTGFSGADLANLCNEAAISAMRRGAEKIEASDFAQAFDKMVLGDLREIAMPPDERRRVAVHEAGHALVALRIPEAEPVKRVSILPRGASLGATRQEMSAERHLATRSALTARLAVLMGGHAAEALLLGDTSSGAENDLREATDLAFRMVARFGMSKRVGPMFHEVREEHPFLGSRLGTASGVSDATTHLIEEEVRATLAEALERATSVLTSQDGGLARLTEGLLAEETINGEQAERLAGPAAPLQRAAE
jgi:cell division protease FtsH